VNDILSDKILFRLVRTVNGAHIYLRTGQEFLISESDALKTPDQGRRCATFFTDGNSRQLRISEVSLLGARSESQLLRSLFKDPQSSGIENMSKKILKSQLAGSISTLNHGPFTGGIRTK
jgi:hypothetical protein